MGDSSWAFNGLGKIARVSNPGSATPNYGLTYDLAMAPHDGPDQFDDLAAAFASYMGLRAPSGTTPIPVESNPTESGFGGIGSHLYGGDDKSLWDRATGAASAVGGALAGTAGEISNVTQFVYSGGQENIDWSWDDTKDKATADTAKIVGKAVEAPVAKQIFWGIEKANEYFSTAAVAATLAEDDTAMFFKAGTWGDAHALTKDRHLNAGEAFAQMFYNKEVLQDEDRFEQIRQHNTVFNVGALAFNVVAAWKADPNVIFGKGIGKARDIAVGKVATNGRTAAVQRDILTQPDLASAKQAAEGYTSLADKLRATHAVSLYDRAQQLRTLAQEVSSGRVGFEDFKNHTAFNNATAGTTLARLMVDVADDDANWNLVFRSALGDPAAVPELMARQGEIADKIAAIELGPMPSLTSELERVEARYNKRLAEQGRPQDARIEITRFGDKWLDDSRETLRAETDALNARLSSYETHDSWLNRALPGVEDSASPNLDAMRTAVNSPFGSLDRLGGDGVIRRSLGANGGMAKMWQHDDYSPTSFLFRAPTKPFLSRIGVVSLNDVDEGAHAITSYLNQLDYIKKGVDQGYRDRTLSAWAGATTDVARKAVVETVERDAIKALGKKHGLSPAIMDKLAQLLQEKRRQTWGEFSDTTKYSPIRGVRGRQIEWVEKGSKVSVKMPVDVTQLPNFHSLTNLTDLDRTIRLHADELRSIDTDLRTRQQAGLAFTERHVRELADSLGTHFNAFWKPLALISVRWPMRVVADESMRAILTAGALTHMANLPVGVRNAVHNVGVVRPYEWWNGRKIKTGSLAEDSLRGGVGNDYDAYDYRAITNPGATMPADAIDFGKLDPKRHDRLNAVTAERWGHLRKIEADKHRPTTAPAQTPAWAKAWDNRLAEVEASAERGIVFDPMRPHLGANKGFAVSVYPGRLRTFPRKPTAREMNYWTEKNSDLLAIPNTRAAVWADKDTGRWHLDVVKTAKRREDAMLMASQANATEFYDIEDGFTRFMSEDYWNHFSSPFVKRGPQSGAAGVAVDQHPLAGMADEIGSQLGVSTGKGPIRKKVGFGQQTWRTSDGRKVTGERVFGSDTENPNIFYGTTSSKGAIEALFSGHAKSLAKDRGSRGATDYKTFDPDNEHGTVEEWASAYAHFVNNHVRYSPLWEKMLAGESDDQVFEWLMSTSAGRAARKRIGARGERPDVWVAHEREIFDHLFPTERSLEAARLGELDPKTVPDLIPEGQRPTVNGDTIKLALGAHAHQAKARWVVDKAMHVLGTMPTDSLVRHPFAQTVYNREMRNYLSSVKSDEVTNAVMAAAEAHARAKALKQVRRVLYNIADEVEGVHMLRFLSPFFQAQVEVLQKYGHIIMDKPETLARIAQLLAGSNVVNTGLWHVQDGEGKTAKGYSNDNQVVFQVGPTLRGLVNHIPGLQGALDKADSLTVPVASLNLILQGDKPYLPSMGPLVTYPASELHFHGKPELDGTDLYQWLYPFGEARGQNFMERGLNSVLPAYARRGLVWGTEDMNDSAFARRVSEIGAQQLYDWEASGKDGPRPTEKQALEAAKAEYRLRMASSIFLPAPVTPRSPFQFWIDQYRQYKAKYGIDADTKFYDAYGPAYFMFAQQATESTGGMSPDTGSKKAYNKYQSLIERAPEMAGILTGPFATGEFSDAVYQWQLTHRVSPGSNKTIRERLSPADRLAQSEVDRGWVEYGKLAAVLDAEVRNRVAQGGSAYLTANTNADLAAYKEQQILELYKRNPAWQDAYKTGRTSHMGTFLKHAYDVMFDKSLDNRTDIQALRAYLIGRARLQDVLIQREQSGQSSSRQFSFDPTGAPIGDNADLYAGWKSWVDETKAANPLFAEIYNRYLESDDLSIYIDPEVSGAAVK